MNRPSTLTAAEYAASYFGRDNLNFVKRWRRMQRKEARKLNSGDVKSLQLLGEIRLAEPNE